MLISIIGGLVTAFSVYQACHAVDTAVQAKKAAKDVADTITNGFDDNDFVDDDDFFDDDVIIEQDPVDDNNSEDNCDDDNSEQQQLPPRNEKGQFTKK